MKKIIFLNSCLLCLLLSGCLVTKKKFLAEQTRADLLEKQNKDCAGKLLITQDSLSSFQNQVKTISEELENSKLGALKLEQNKKKLTNDLETLTSQFDRLKKQYDEFGKSSSSEKEKLNLALLDKERELNEKASLLTKTSSELSAREKRVNELESLIAKKDEAVNNLRNKMSEALSHFNSDELKVTQQDGKVYVSLSDKLLFKSGSFSVDEKGKQAILKVAEVMNKQPNVSMEIEGHTDNKQYVNPKGDIKNNWDLSVMRASAVTLIMTKEGWLDPTRIRATGHSEFSPLESNDTPEGRSRNRRTEIILLPDLKEIMQILNK